MEKVNNRNMKVSVIICTKNRFKDLTTCVESILIQTQVPDEIIIVDSSDKENIDVKPLQISIEISIEYIHTKVSLTQARNIGINKSKGDIILFLDDDVILDKNFVKEIVNVFENDNTKRIGGVTGNIINMTKPKNSLFIKRVISSIMYGLVIVFFLPRIYSDGKFLLSGHPTGVFITDKMVLIESLAGSNMAFRKEILYEYKFDENLDGYCFMEDCDISYRISRKYQTVLTPYAKLIHNLSPVARDKEYESAKMMIENHYYLFKKNFPQDIEHRIAFWWSVVGFFVMGAIGRNKERLRGFTDGLLNIRQRKSYNMNARNPLKNDGAGSK